MSSAEPGREECFRCRVRSVGFTFRAAGYGRKAFNDSTIAEKRAEMLDGRTLGVDTEPASTYGW
jgi:hypothetical protein